jgi:hypothetical protein
MPKSKKTTTETKEVTSVTTEESQPTMTIPTPPNESSVFAQPVPPPPSIPITDQISESQMFRNLNQMADFNAQRLKYPLLQQRQLLYFRLDKDTAAQMINLLEETGWTQTDAATLMVRQFFLFTRSGAFQFMMNTKLFESDKIEDLKLIRDTLKPVGPRLLEVMKNSVWKNYRKSLVTQGNGEATTA